MATFVVGLCKALRFLSTNLSFWVHSHARLIGCHILSVEGDHDCVILDTLREYRLATLQSFACACRMHIIPNFSFSSHYHPYLRLLTIKGWRSHRLQCWINRKPSVLLVARTSASLPLHAKSLCLLDTDLCTSIPAKPIVWDASSNFPRIQFFSRLEMGIRSAILNERIKKSGPRKGARDRKSADLQISRAQSVISARHSCSFPRL